MTRKELAILSGQGLSFFLSVVALTMAFSPDVRRAILERDGYRSVETGRRQNLEAAHDDHSKSNPDYDTPENGKTLTRVEHYKDHVDRAGKNGLRPHHNDWALRSIWKRLSMKDKLELFEEGYPDPDGDYEYIELKAFT